MSVATPRFDEFWRLQEDFLARHRDVRGSRSIERKGAAWQARGEAYLRATKVKFSKDTAIRVSETEQRRSWESVLAQLDQVEDATIEAFDRHMGDMAINAAEKWPVDTGLSRAALSLRFYRLAPGVIGGTLRSGAPYTPFIRPSGEREDRAAAKERGEKFKAKKGRPTGWKMQFLVKVGDTWVFDKERYNDRRKAERAANPDRKPATVSPYPALVRKPSKPTLDTIARDVLEEANKGSL
jgi:hypothetical protein